MKHTMKRTLSFVLAVAMVLSCMTGLTTKAVAAETDTVTVSVSGDSIVIGNGYISREFSTAGDKLSTTKIDNKRANEVFAPAAGSEEFIIRVTKAGNSAAPAVPALDRTGWTASSRFPPTRRPGLRSPRATPSTAPPRSSSSPLLPAMSA